MNNTAHEFHEQLDALILRRVEVARKTDQLESRLQEKDPAILGHLLSDALELTAEKLRVDFLVSELPSNRVKELSALSRH